ncbi:hypothetical protein BJX65DRAFT_32932 [Aspergillus insuetus]
MATHPKLLDHAFELEHYLHISHLLRFMAEFFLLHCGAELSLRSWNALQHVLLARVWWETEESIDNWKEGDMAALCASYSTYTLSSILSSSLACKSLHVVHRHFERFFFLNQSSIKYLQRGCKSCVYPAQATKEGVSVTLVKVSNGFGHVVVDWKSLRRSQEGTANQNAKRPQYSCELDVLRSQTRKRVELRGLRGSCEE